VFTQPSPRRLSVPIVVALAVLVLFCCSWLARPYPRGRVLSAKQCFVVETGVSLHPTTLTVCEP
jgi:hypothetical protein